MKENRTMAWGRALNLVLCCSCVRKRRPEEEKNAEPECKRTRGVKLSQGTMDKSLAGHFPEWRRQHTHIQREGADTGSSMDEEGPHSKTHQYTERQHTNGTDTSLESVDTPSIKRSQPVSIQQSRLKEEVPQASSLPSIPNPFPELCSPSNSPVLIGSPLGQGISNTGATHVVKVSSEDGWCRSLTVTASTTARDICQLLVQKMHCVDQESWALVELHPHLGLERCLEDHEAVVGVQATWPLEGECKFVFRKNYAKYEFFKKPMLFFPEHMISDCVDANKGMTSSELIQNLLNSGSCPEIQGSLHVKDATRKVWKKCYFFLRKSGLYFSSKGDSKEPRHLQYVADLEELNIYSISHSKKLHSAPTEFAFCVKPCRNRNRNRDLKLLCAEDEQIRTCWITAFRLFKYGKQLQCNYQLSLSMKSQGSASESSTKKCPSDNCLVAMDFSGTMGGRVIENPREAQSVALEEGQAWRKKTNHRYSLPNSCRSPFNTVIHRTQAWFHGGISRKEAQRLIMEQGHVDGMFLIRESQQHAKCFVLSLSFQLKTKHYLIIPCEDNGHFYYTMDDGETLFSDLIQLVEFHQINRGILPVRLQHYCVRVAL
ncbi:growth factor receptor-bound protein 7 isoform X1 [Polypterus senegalus]